MTIKGHVDKTIPNIKPRIVVNYDSNTEDCKVTVNWLAGINTSLRISQEFVLDINSKGYFEQKVVLDKYLPGKCEWRMRTIKYAIEDPIPSEEIMKVLVFFNNSLKPDDRLKSGKEIVACGLSSCVTQQVSGFFEETSNLSLYQNYQLTLNIIKE